MRHVDEYRDPSRARVLVEEIRKATTRSWVVMEICGGQTHSLLRHGIPDLLPPALELVHGPGCPVCVTPLEMIDRAHALARRPEVILASFGDMLRVPGSDGTLLSLRSLGADVRIVYSPLDALALARAHPDRQIVFFAVGFETTAPANAMAVYQAHREGLGNFSALVSHVLVPPAIDAILGSQGNRVQGFLGPGHVSTVVGLEEYRVLVARHRVPIVVTGFEPVDLLDGLLRLVRQLEGGRAELENAYARVVRETGNQTARSIVEEVFEICDRKWRGVGTLEASGFRLRGPYREHDASLRFGIEDLCTAEDPTCIAGEILQGRKRPPDCPAFGRQCTPETPLGATMVSSEGACAAYFAYARRTPGAGTGAA